MLSGIYEKLISLIKRNSSSSYIAFTLRVRLKTKSLKNAISKCENSVLCGLQKDKDPSKLWKQTNKKRQAIPPYIHKNPRFVTDELEDEYNLNTWKSFYSLISDSFVLPTAFSSSQGQN